MISKPAFDVYHREDGTCVVHIETFDIPENSEGPQLVVYLNDGTPPLWDNPVTLNGKPNG